jgi:hypothetical protein
MGNNQAAAERHESNNERPAVQHQDTSNLVSLSDMQSHQQNASQRGTEQQSSSVLERGGLNMDTRGLYSNSGEKERDRERTETEKVTKKSELVQTTSDHVDVMGNPYVHLSGPAEYQRGQSKAVTVTERNLDSPPQQRQDQVSNNGGGETKPDESNIRRTRA